MTTMASRITSLTVVYSTVYSHADQRKLQSSASLAFVWRIHRDRWIPAQKASYAENVSIWWRHHDVPGMNSEYCGKDSETERKLKWSCDQFWVEVTFYYIINFSFM